MKLRGGVKILIFGNDLFNFYVNLSKFININEIICYQKLHVNSFEKNYKTVIQYNYIKTINFYALSYLISFHYFLFQILLNNYTAKEINRQKRSLPERGSYS